MNAQLLCLVAVLSADPQPAPPAQPESAASMYSVDVRGQSPGALAPSYTTTTPTSTLAPPTFTPPVQVSQVYGSPQPYTSGDPFVTTQPMQGDPYAPMPGTYDPNMQGGYYPQPGAVPQQGPYSFYGLNGPQPIRYGWSSNFDVGLISNADVDGPYGKFGVFELDWQLRRTWQAFFDSAFSWSPEFNYRNWNVPSGLAIDSNVFRFASDFQLSTSVSQPYSVELGFTPQIGTDFNSPTSDAWMWDGRGALFIRTSPQWTWAIGAQYWDRVDNLIVPYAGVIWRPDTRWEFTLVWPRPRIDYFLGQTFLGPLYFYGRGEYHVEAYEVTLKDIDQNTRMQVEDFRILMGFRNCGPYGWGFLEAGWVFNREFSFDAYLPDLDISTGFIARMGIRF